ncbi:hypothetical protein SAMN05444167_2228 [Terriglobus roseus]|uniref:Uncharacterized protein n=1 Tax=Terriglobus roseus TaxID=392734 RepID=A0A1G7KL49_9BACT|nr:hypothetical protein SAMN05444167_2228 [Terriglobus roseus]
MLYTVSSYSLVGSSYRAGFEDVLPKDHNWPSQVYKTAAASCSFGRILGLFDLCTSTRSLV